VSLWQRLGRLSFHIPDSLQGALNKIKEVTLTEFVFTGFVNKKYSPQRKVRGKHGTDWISKSYSKECRREKNVTVLFQHASK